MLFLLWICIIIIILSCFPYLKDINLYLQRFFRATLWCKVFGQFYFHSFAGLVRPSQCLYGVLVDGVGRSGKILGSVPIAGNFQGVKISRIIFCEM